MFTHAAASSLLFATALAPQRGPFDSRERCSGYHGRHDATTGFIRGDYLLPATPCLYGSIHRSFVSAGQRLHRLCPSLYEEALLAASHD